MELEDSTTFKPFEPVDQEPKANYIYQSGAFHTKQMVSKIQDASKANIKLDCNLQWEQLEKHKDDDI